ncbi:hypothetical protein [Mucilaginibacter sp.]|uniref:hypothetical protein n=1 Tax=Mucilaginibacter sp. TaxID=1882438 RepID=UPI00261B2373|nr:hypothetical protein [Mucilaginibacter sp.]MDB5031012.1 hypothetical protein [Mucilaginibacter sp.]
MKLLVTYMRHISLLLICGLILTLYINSIAITNKAEKHVTVKGKSLLVCNTSDPVPFSVLNDIVVTFFPALKNEINL